MVRTVLWLASVVAASAAMDVNRLQRDPQFVPAKTTVTKEIRYANGFVLAAGTTASVVSLAPQIVTVMPAGRNDRFGVPIESTSLLADADAAYAQLTPNQQNSTLQSLVARKDRWPYRVTFNHDIVFNGGKTFRAGSKEILHNFDGKNVVIYVRETNATFSFPAQMTDVFAQCLTAIEQPPMSRLYHELQENLLDPTTDKPTALFDHGGPDYIAVYNAAGWCPFCAQTTPDVLKWQNAALASGKHRVALILVSCDKSEADYRDYRKKAGYQCPYVKWGADQRMPILAASGLANGLPNLIVFDRTGKLVVDSTNDQPKPRTLAALARMTALQNSALATR